MIARLWRRLVHAFVALACAAGGRSWSRDWWPCWAASCWASPTACRSRSSTTSTATCWRETPSPAAAGPTRRPSLGAVRIDPHHRAAQLRLEVPAGPGAVPGRWVYRLGHPILGVWVSLALASAALCWMLQGWLPPRWALVGALLGTARLTFGTDSLLEGGGDPYWGTSYWGGAVAMLGGCLLLGAYPRLRAGPRVRDAVWMGVGLVLLANTRPYEGLALCLPVGGALAAWVLGRHRPPLRVLLLRVGLPLLAVLVPAALLMMEYNRHVTGDPLLLPYLSHGQQYEPVPVMLFLPERPEPVYRHKSIRDLHAVWAVDVYRRQQTLGGWADEAGEKLLRMWSFYLGPTLSVPFLALPWVLCRRGVPLALAGVGAVVAAQVVVGTWSYNHYGAPATGLVFFLVAACLRRLAGWRAGRVWSGWSC